MTEFQQFAKLVHDRYNLLAKHELYETADEYLLNGTYLAAFPAGTNPIYKTNTEHDCSCCKQFIRNLGNLVAIIDGKVETIWDIKGAPYPYDVVAKEMHEFVLSRNIRGIFRTSEGGFGAQETKQLLEDNSVKRWNHFHGDVAARHKTREAGTVIGAANSTAQVLRRGLEELTLENLQTVRDLIDDNLLYRGSEHRKAVVEMLNLKKSYMKLGTEAERDVFVWSNYMNPAARFRNTVIGTLVQDLCDGKSIDQAVKSFEAKVAPANYKRPTALVTPAMVNQAMKTIGELGYEPALERRMARISDVSVNNVLWVDNTVKPMMKGGIGDILMAAAKKKPLKDLKAESISIEDFLNKVMPNADSIEMLVENKHIGNFMTLTAPVHADAAGIFKWGNNFGWSYSGNVTDSIKEKVKRAGGNTDAPLRVSLAWFNYDDLDIQVTEPNGNVISFFNKDGKLDVDMNAGGGRSREPVENVSWKKPLNGVYTIKVNQYHRRETSDVGFVIEIENNGAVQQYQHEAAASGLTTVGKLVVANGVITEINLSPCMKNGVASKDQWGIKTQQFVKVNTILNSPNHWDGEETGNKHVFFILDGCKTPDAVRGIYNEFLNSKLDVHRKVFELLGDKTKCAPTDDQLSGLGFSTTQDNTATIKVVCGALSQVFNIKF